MLTDDIEILLRWGLNKSQIADVTNKIIKQHSAAIDQLLLSNASGEQFIQRLDCISGNIKPLISSCIFPAQMHSNLEVRDAAAAASTTLAKYFATFNMRKDVWKRFRAASQEIKNNPICERAVELMMINFNMCGVDLPLNISNSLIELRLVLSQLVQDFQRNLAENTTAINFEPHELAGMDNEFIKARQSGDRITIKLNYPDVKPIIAYATNPTTRKITHKAFTQRCVKQNTKILCEIVKLKAQEASMLGYKSHADMILQHTIVKKPEIAKKYLRDVYNAILPNAKRFIKHMKIWAKSDKAELDASSVSYYSTKVLRSMYESDTLQNHEKYFAVSDVIKSTLDIYMNLFDLKFIHDSSVEVWHPQVMFYKVQDGNGRIVGGFYLDLYVREGKFGHYAEFNLQPAGVNTKGVVCVLANFEKVDDDSVCSLEFNEVKTFFHEFGHVLHEICYTGKYYIMSGIAVEHDFVEAPSQMFENWCYQSTIMRKLSGGKIPDDVVERIISKKCIDTAWTWISRIYMSMFDLELYTMSAMEAKDFTEDKLRALWIKCSEMSLVPIADYDCSFASFMHIVGDYSARYYGYLLSRAIGNDMYKIAQTSDGALKFKSIVLSSGGMKPAQQMYLELTGKEFNIKSLVDSIVKDFTKCDD